MSDASRPPAGDGVQVVVPGDEPPQLQGSPHLERLRAHPRVTQVTVYDDRPADLATQLGRAAEAQVIINSRGAVQWRAEALRQLPALQLIATCSIGTDMIDLEAAKAAGVLVSNQPGRTAPVVAEHAVGLMFAAAKRAAFFTREMRAGNWPRIDGVYLQGKRLGVVGTGDIGAQMARLGNALGMEVVAWTYNPEPQRAAALGVTYVELDELLATSDVVSIHVRLSEQSRGLIGAAQMSPRRRAAGSSARRRSAA